MLCAIYKSAKKPNTYLYIAKRDQFSAVPEALMTTFGRPIFLMMFNLAGAKDLAHANKQEVLQQIEEKGFYLQMLNEDDIFKDFLAQ